MTNERSWLASGLVFSAATRNVVLRFLSKHAVTGGASNLIAGEIIIVGLAAIAVAIEAGALAGKVSGAGGCGFMMFTVGLARRPDVIRPLSRRHEGRLLPCHFTKHGTEGWRLY
jgi:galactokinase/mevalonate kinase-like predicted kinase